MQTDRRAKFLGLFKENIYAIRCLFVGSERLLFALLCAAAPLFFVTTGLPRLLDVIPKHRLHATV